MLTGLPFLLPPVGVRSWEAEQNLHVEKGAPRLHVLIVPNSSLGCNTPFQEARGTTEKGGHRKELLGGRTLRTLHG